MNIKCKISPFKIRLSSSFLIIIMSIISILKLRIVFGKVKDKILRGNVRAYFKILNYKSNPVTKLKSIFQLRNSGLHRDTKGSTRNSYISYSRAKWSYSQIA